MAHPCGCGLFVLEGPGNCSGSSGRQWARRPRLSDGLFVDQGGVGLSRPQRPHFTTRTKIQGGGADLWDLLALDQALAQAAKGNRVRGALSHSRSSGQEGRPAGRVVTRPARKRSRPDAGGALRGVRGGFESKGLRGYHEPEHFSPSGRLAAQKKSRVAQERDEELRRLWKWLASRFDARRLIFIDESGFHTSMTRLRARAPKGE